MNSFTWRGLHCLAREKRIECREDHMKHEPKTDIIFEFPVYIIHASVMDQNIIVVLLEDKTLWQCGGVPQGPLVLAAAANKVMIGWILSTLSRLAPETYAQAVLDLKREYDKTFKDVTQPEDKT